MSQVSRQRVAAIEPECVAKKLAGIRNHEYPELLEQITARPRLVEMMWFLQYTSKQPGGLVKLCADMCQQMPDRFGTREMRQAKRAEYTLEQKLTISSEMPEAYGRGSMPHYGDDDNGVDDDWTSTFGIGRKLSEEVRAKERKELEQYIKSWTAQEICETCRLAAMDILPRYLEDLCIVPGMGFMPLSDGWPDYGKSPYWFMEDPVAVVFEWMDLRAKEVSNHLAMTVVAKKVFDALDYALEERVMVRIEGESRFGKTESVKTWAEMRPGRARLVNVPSSNSITGLLRRVAEALGIVFPCGTRVQVLEERIEYVLQQSGLFLILDESAFLIPQNYSATTVPERLNWVRTEVVDRGLPLALVHTPQTFLPDAARFVKKTRFAMEQFFGRSYRTIQLPDKLPLGDLIAVARIHFPEMDDEDLEDIADRAQVSENYLQAVEAIAKLARHIARVGRRQRITFSDIEAATEEIIPHEIMPDRPSAGTAQKAGVRQMPARATASALKAPFKGAARAVQSGQVQPAREAIAIQPGGVSNMVFPNRSLRGAGLERTQPDPVLVES